MDANRRAEILQAVELNDRDLLSEIAELEAENKRLEVVNKESQRQLAILDSDKEMLEDERDSLKAAITTPELYVGVVSEILAEERESAVAENSNLRAMLERLVAAANEAKGELEYDITNGSVAIDILKDAIAESKEVIQ